MAGDTSQDSGDLARRASEEGLRAQADQAQANSLMLQRSLLPTSVVADPRLEISHSYEAFGPLDAVGGDWYDTFQWANGSVGIMVGDVVGHSLEAAATMGHLRAGVAALAPHVPAHADTWMGALAECVDGPNGTDFVTAACVVIDPATGGLTHCSAGHPPILILTPGEQPRWLSRPQGPPLGVAANSSHQAGSLTLSPGAVVVLYSDGLIERRYELITDGLARLLSTVSALNGEGGDDLSDAIINRMAQHSLPEDDTVVVTVRYQPAHADP